MYLQFKKIYYWKSVYSKLTNKFLEFQYWFPTKIRILKMHNFFYTLLIKKCLVREAYKFKQQTVTKTNTS